MQVNVSVMFFVLFCYLKKSVFIRSSPSRSVWDLGCVEERPTFNDFTCLEFNFLERFGKSYVKNALKCYIDWVFTRAPNRYSKIAITSCVARVFVTNNKEKTSTVQWLVQFRAEFISSLSTNNNI